MLSVLALALFVAWMVASVASRAYVLSRTESRRVDPKPSPISEALKHTVATAGGIYVIIVALLAFLDLDLPQRVSLVGVEFNPVALLSLVLATLQPYLHLIRS